MLIAVYNIPAIRKMIRLFDFRAKRIVWQIGIFADYSSSHGLSVDIKWDPNGIICRFAQDKLREGAREKNPEKLSPFTELGCVCVGLVEGKFMVIG